MAKVATIEPVLRTKAEELKASLRELSQTPPTIDKLNDLVEFVYDELNGAIEKDWYPQEIIERIKTHTGVVISEDDLRVQLAVVKRKRSQSGGAK